MIYFRLLPVFLSFLLVAAHFYRADLLAVAVLFLSAPVLLFFRRPFSARIIQALLILSAAEWSRTLFVLVQMRQHLELPWGRLALILATVILFTASCALLFRFSALRNHYKI